KNMFLVLHTGHSNSFGDQVIANGVARLHESPISAMGGVVASVGGIATDAPTHRTTRKSRNERGRRFNRFSLVANSFCKAGTLKPIVQRAHRKWRTQIWPKRGKD